MRGENGVVGGGNDSPTSSPKNKVKFLCSYGGKILPKPSDGNLKYVGGETRVISVHRDITFSDLMKKMSALIDGDIVLKYQLLPQDLDALVSVRSDEDLKYMLDEHDRQESEGTPKLRAFLFPSKPIIIESNTAALEIFSLEQRYIDAINGVIRTSLKTKLSPLKPCSTSSACSSPNSNSPEGHAVEPVFYDNISLTGFRNSRAQMQRVQSSPSICGLNNLHNNGNGNGNSSGSSPLNNMHHCHSSYFQNHYHHHHQQRHGFQSSSRLPPFDQQKCSGSDRLTPALSMGRADHGGRGLPGVFNHYHQASRHQSHLKGIGGSTKYGGHEECAYYGCGRFDRVESRPRSPKVMWE